MNNKKSEENDKIEVSNVYEMFEEVKGLQEKLLTAIEKLCSKLTLVPESESTPVLNPEDGQRIETLIYKLDTVSGKLDRPLRHHHTLDFMGDRALIALAATVAAFLVSFWIIHNTCDIIARNRDNDLKYRYIQMRDETTPADILKLRNAFDFNRNPDSIKIIRRQAIEYERLIIEQAENVARAKLNASEAERLQDEVETVRRREIITAPPLAGYGQQQQRNLIAPYARKVLMVGMLSKAIRSALCAALHRTPTIVAQRYDSWGGATTERDS